MPNSARNTPMCDEMTGDFVKAQSRADQVALALGNRAGAPRWMDGERLNDYRRRLLQPLKELSPTWKAVDIPRAEDVLRVAESQIYADAAREAAHPSNVPPGQLVERITQDQAGRQITRFYGDVEQCYGMFKYPAKAVTGFPGGRR
jgi:hypothetical protein